MGVLDQLIMAPRKRPGITTPGFNGKPVLLPSPAGGPPVDAGPAIEGESEATKQARTLIAAGAPAKGEFGDVPGHKIGGLRRVLGEIASNAAPFVNPRFGAGLAALGNKALYPGAEDYQSKVGRLLTIGDLDTKAQAQANTVADRKLNQGRLLQTQKDAENKTFSDQVKGMTDNNKGVELGDLPDTPANIEMPVRQSWMHPAIAGVAPISSQIVQQGTQEIDPEGKPVNQNSVTQVRSPDGKLVRIKRKTWPEQQQEKADLATQAKRDARDVTQAGWLPATDEMGGIGIKSGTMLSPADFLHAQTVLKENNNPKPSAEAEKIKFQNIVAKLSSEGSLTPAALSDVRMVARAIQGSQTLTSDEKNGAMAWLAANPNPAAQGTNTTLRAEGMGRQRLFQAIDSTTGQPVFITPEENAAEPKRYLPSGPATSAMSKGAIFKDIHYNARQARTAIQALESMDPKTRAELALALKDQDPKSSIGAFLTGVAATTMTPQQEDAVIALRNLQENAMALRAIGGMGQGSDALRAAILATLPNARTPNKGYALKQLDQFENIVKNLESGIPNVSIKGQSVTESTNAPSSTPTVDPKLQEYADKYFGGDVAAAQAYQNKGKK